MENKQPESLFISLAPLMKGLLGHDINYHQGIESATESLDWQFSLLLPRSTSMHLPSHWIKCLQTDNKLNYTKSLLSNLLNLFHQYPNTQSNIIFLESFIDRDLEVISEVISLLPAEKLSVWILHRYHPKYSFSFNTYQSCYRRLETLLGKDQITLFTDNNLLKNAWEALLPYSIHVLPVPHCYDLPTLNLPHIPKEIPNIWWRSHQPRLKAIYQRLEDKGLIKPKNGQIYTDDSLPINKKTQDNGFSRKAYIDSLAYADVMVLPYLSPHYIHSTSGIFIERIYMGKPVIVPSYTWAARELEAYGLSELIMEWYKPDIFQNIVDIYYDQEIHDKLYSMSQFYQKTHQLQSIAYLFNQLASVKRL